MHFWIDVPEWSFGIGTALLLLGLGYGGWRAGWLSRRERERLDTATVAAQAQEQPQEKSRQGGQRAGWPQGVLQPSDLVCHDGLRDWMRASTQRLCQRARQPVPQAPSGRWSR